MCEGEIQSCSVGSICCAGHQGDANSEAFGGLKGAGLIRIVLNYEPCNARLVICSDFVCSTEFPSFSEQGFMPTTIKNLVLETPKPCVSKTI